jgi:hypothetical protein
MPFAPEPIESLRARYPAALAEPCDVETSRLGTTFGPGQLRRCVFDCTDGIRLIISRDLQESRQTLHLSASAQEGSRIWNLIHSEMIGPHDFVPMVESRFREISGDDGPLDFGGFSSGKGVPHWFRPLGKEAAVD